ncbi:MAG TPA: DUF3800 domain-containing protein [Anaerolineales bacterium]|nr:DUF3800 domain-containing protein [Anaerolineales bacterium]
MMAPFVDFDGTYTFYYDETNNIRKFYVKETGFNSFFTNNFILGGLAHEGPVPNVQPLIDGLNLQKSINEIKFKHIAKGSFIECLKSGKLKLFLKYISDSNLNIHFSSINILYWSLVDIVDSAISISGVDQQLSLPMINVLKNDLYKLAKIKIDSITSLFYRYGYPNIKQSEVTSFIEEISELFKDYLDDMEFHFGLETLRQVLKVAKKKESLPFVMDGEKHLLIKDFSHFYLRPIYLFKHSRHVFDNEDSIVDILSKYQMMDGSQELENFSFEDSKSNELIQLSDVVVGLIGKFHSYLNTSTKNAIHFDCCGLNSLQSENIDLLLSLIDQSFEKNIGFLHSIDSIEELSKIDVIRGCRV